MIEEVVLRHLESELEEPVFMEVPEDAPDEFVLVQKTAGGSENYIKSAMIAVQSYAGSLLKAAQLNEKIKKAMDQLTDQKEVSKSKLNSDYNFTDTTTKRYRYQAVYDVTHY